jgi:hypothetical protein
MGRIVTGVLAVVFALLTVFLLLSVVFDVLASQARNNSGGMQLIPPADLYPLIGLLMTAASLIVTILFGLWARRQSHKGT